MSRVNRRNRAKHFFQKSFRNEIKRDTSVMQQKRAFLTISENRVWYNGDTGCVNTRLAV